MFNAPAPVSQTQTIGEIAGIIKTSRFGLKVMLCFMQVFFLVSSWLKFLADSRSLITITGSCSTKSPPKCCLLNRLGPLYHRLLAQGKLSSESLCVQKK